MKNIKYIIVTLAVGFLSSTTLLSQNQTQHKHEFSVYGATGLSTLKYETSVGNQKDLFGGSIGLGYSYFFTNNWALNTGAELSFYNAETTFNKLSDSYMTVDIDNNAFELRSVISNYKEKQNASYLNIPIMLQHQVPTGSSHMFYAAAGMKLGIPLSSKYKTSGATIVNTGYYGEFEPEYPEQKFMGLGTFTDKNMNEDLKFKVAYLVALEAGMKWKLNSGMALYTGAYFDYGLNDIRESKRERDFVAFNLADPENFKTNSILMSKYSKAGNSENLTKKVVPMAAGIKLRLAFGNKMAKTSLD